LSAKLRDFSAAARFLVTFLEAWNQENPATEDQAKMPARLGEMKAHGGLRLFIEALRLQFR
jgi:hypothetical protein